MSSAPVISCHVSNADSKHLAQDSTLPSQQWSDTESYGNPGMEVAVDSCMVSKQFWRKQVHSAMASFINHCIHSTVPGTD